MGGRRFRRAGSGDAAMRGDVIATFVGWGQRHCRAQDVGGYGDLCKVGSGPRGVADLQVLRCGRDR